MSSLFGKKKKAKTALTSNNNNIELDSSKDQSNNDDKDLEVNTAIIRNSPTVTRIEKSDRLVCKKKKRYNENNDDDDDDEGGDRIFQFSDLKLCAPLLRSCSALGFKRPTAVQRTVIPAVLGCENSHILALSATGSGKTAAFVLPILHRLSEDPYGIFAVVLTPTRELAKQIVEQILALGRSSLQVRASLVVGGMDMVQQACELETVKPHFVVATPGRLASLLRGPNPPILQNVRFVVLDEADRLLSANGSGFERDVAEILLHSTSRPSSGGSKRIRRTNCQTLLFSATLTRSLASLEEMAGAGMGRLPLKKIVIRDDNAAKKKKKMKNNNKRNRDEEETHSDLQEDDDSDSDENDAPSIPTIPEGLKQEYLFMPSRVRDTYLVATIRALMYNRGRNGRGGGSDRRDASGWNNAPHAVSDDEHDELETTKARSAVVFVSTCERTALLSGVLSQLGVSNVALHSLLSQNRRLASLAKFKSQQVRVLVATDVCSRGLDIPTVDLVINCELPRRSVDYVHRVGRTARAGRRGRAISLVGERDVALVHAAERVSGRQLDKCLDVTDDMAIQLLSPVSKAVRLTKMQLSDIGFDELVRKMKERKARDRKERIKAERSAAKILNKQNKKNLVETK